MIFSQVALIFGITGAIRKGEYCSIKTTDIEDYGSHLLITVRNTKTHNPRHFVVVDELHYNIYKKYQALRPKNTESDRFFMNYQNGKCTHQFIGINKFGKMPKKIAQFLKLPDVDLYTGHSFRRTSAQFLNDCAANVRIRRRPGRPNDDTESNIGDSENNKRKIDVRESNSNGESEIALPSLKRVKEEFEENFGASSSKGCDSGN